MVASCEVIAAYAALAVACVPAAALLDYEESDDSEAQMELALLAEGFHEMLMKGYGDAITRALLLDRCACMHHACVQACVLGVGRSP